MVRPRHLLWASLLLLVAGALAVLATEDGGVAIPPGQSGNSSSGAPASGPAVPAGGQTTQEQEDEAREAKFISSIDDGFAFFMILMLGILSFMTQICACGPGDIPD